MIPKSHMPASADAESPYYKGRGCAGLFFVMALVVAGAYGAGLGVFVWILEDDAGQTMKALDDFRPKIGSKVYATDGEFLGEFATTARQLVSLNEMPLQLQKAFIATEDGTFYNHKGVRPLAIASAVVDAARTNRLRGASTITQQTVRNIDQTGISTEQTFQRKIKEAVFALQLEQEFTKDEILEIYLNQIFLGVSAYGVEAAARQYFNKSVSDLTLGECATLAGLTRAPNINNPFRSMENAHARRNIVLAQMLKNEFITEEEMEAAKAERLEDSVVTPEERQRLREANTSLWALNEFKAPYFVEEVRRFISRPPPPYEVNATQDELFEGGLEIFTTIDMRLQEAAERILNHALDEFDQNRLEFLRRRGREEEFVPVSGALVCLDNREGREGFVRAMVGGRDFRTQKFNMATQARRQPGSSIKPFVWLVAVDNGMTPSSIIIDEPFVRRAGSGTLWAPKNFSGTFEGPVPLRYALEKSINIVSVKLVERFSMPTVRNYLQDAGFRQPIDNDASLTLGLGSKETTVLDQAVCYSTLALGGVHVDPTFVMEIKDRDGFTRYDYRKFRQKKQVFNADACYVVTHMMQGVASADHRLGHYPSGWRTEALGRPRAGKTGTTNDSKDVWFGGYTPQYTCVVWVGYEDNTSLGSGQDYTGGRLSSPIWTDFMIVAHEGLPVEDFKVPPGVEFHNINRLNGVAGGSYREAFIRGTKPPTGLTVYERREEELMDLLEQLEPAWSADLEPLVPRADPTQ